MSLPKLVCAAAAVLLTCVSGALASAPPLASASEACRAGGGPCTPSSPESRAPLPGLDTNTILVWENGPANGFNGWSSERNTSISGTGGPTGNHASTITDDFQVSSAVGQLTFYACLLTTPQISSAEMWVWANSGGAPQLPVTSPILGAPTTANISSTTYLRNTSYCPDSFQREGRLYVFSRATTGVSLTLPPGTYWFSAIGVDAGAGRAFFATSTPTVPLSVGRTGSTFFGQSYWTPITTLSTDTRDHNFAFRVTGEVITQAIPTVSTWGFVALGVGLAAAALWVLRLRR